MLPHLVFPTIKTINDVLPAIQGKTEFIVAEREYFDVINYVVMTPTSFPPLNTPEDCILRECRGIMFDKKGNLLSRPFHKFFNYNEREETQAANLPLKYGYSIYTKEDGSMIRPVWIETLKEFWWCTKMGMSDTAVNANAFANSKPNYIRFAEFCNNVGITPIFEWCSNKNRIVISHPEDKLVLLAARYNQSGKYMPRDILSGFAIWCKIPMVEHHTNLEFDSLVGNVKDIRDIEGFIVQFKNGDMIKLKTDEYLRIHKARETVTNERALAELFIENKLDDIKPSLTEDDLKVVTDFESLISEKINAKINWLDKEFIEVSNKYPDKKSFALGSTLDSIHKSMIFSKIDGKESVDIVLSLVKKNLSSQTKYQFLMENLLSV